MLSKLALKIVFITREQGIGFDDFYFLLHILFLCAFLLILLISTPLKSLFVDYFTFNSII